MTHEKEFSQQCTIPECSNTVFRKMMCRYHYYINLAGSHPKTRKKSPTPETLEAYTIDLTSSNLSVGTTSPSIDISGLKEKVKATKQAFDKITITQEYLKLYAGMYSTDPTDVRLSDLIAVLASYCGIEVK